MNAETEKPTEGSKSAVDAVVMRQPQPMSTAPEDYDTVILAWHKVWKCWLSIRRRDVVSGVYPNNCNWIEATLSTAWPDESFTHWIKPPAAP